MNIARGLALLSVLGLVGCGFSPIYGDKGADRPAVAQALNNIYVENIPDEQGQSLRNKLIDRLYFKGRPKNPMANLSVTLKTRETSLGLQKDATTTRSQLTMTASYTLTSTITQKALFSGVATSTASYSKLDAQYGTLSTQRDSYKRAMIDISEQIINGISLYYAEKEHAQPSVRRVPGSENDVPQSLPSAR
jgi:LPS-assembly lipoprotein